MNRCVIIGGADIDDYGRIRRFLNVNDFFVCCDSGLKHAAPLGIRPSLIVGDFDSHERPDTETETIVLPREKDDTDTVYAVKEAIRRGYEDFLLIGVIGKRFDHTFGNVSLLLYLDSAGKTARILDDYSEMEIISEKTAEIDASYAFFSLLNISGYFAPRIVIPSAIPLMFSKEK
jgi:thiamine pyrophosphokinase